MLRLNQAQRVVRWLHLLDRDGLNGIVLHVFHFQCLTVVRRVLTHTRIRCYQRLRQFDRPVSGNAVRVLQLNLEVLKASVIAQGASELENRRDESDIDAPISEVLPTELVLHRDLHDHEGQHAEEQDCSYCQQYSRLRSRHEVLVPAVLVHRADVEVVVVLEPDVILKLLPKRLLFILL